MPRPTEKQLFRYVSGESNLEERIEISNWALDNPNNDLEVRTIRKMFLASLINTDSTVTTERRNRPHIKSTAMTRWMISSLSAAALLLFGVFIGNKFLDNGTEPNYLYPAFIQAPEGQRTHTVLSDGTEVWLNSNTKLDFINNDKDYRHVVLDGEARFDVAHNEARPFIVETPKSKVKVLGTVFDIRSYKSDDVLIVKLFEGKVTVNEIDGTPICTLSPNEMVIASNGSYEKKEIDMMNSIDWNGGFYSFKNESYSKIFKTIEAYYNTKIIVCDKEIGNYTCTARFKQDDTLNQILSSMASVHSFKWKRSADNSSIQIYK